jgi:hypothetical protein
MNIAMQVPEGAGPEWWEANIFRPADEAAFADGVELWMASLQDHAPGREYIDLLSDVVRDTPRGT